MFHKATASGGRGSQRGRSSREGRREACLRDKRKHVVDCVLYVRPFDRSNAFSWRTSDEIRAYTSRLTERERESHVLRAAVVLRSILLSLPIQSILLGISVRRTELSDRRVL